MWRSAVAMTLLALACAGNEARVGADESDSSTDTTGNSETVTEPTPTTFEMYPDADLTDPAVVEALAMLSAEFQYQHLTAISEIRDSGDFACPTLLMDPDSGAVTITGGCTDKNGIAWTGQAVIVESDAAYTMTMTGWGYSGLVVDCPAGDVVRNQLLDGVIHVDFGSHEFSLDLVGSETAFDFVFCDAEERTFALEYAGEHVLLYDGSVYSGSGRYTDAVYGRVDAQTVAQVDDTTCATEAESGVTVLAAGGHVATIVYDGGLTCSRASTWSLDGQDQGQILVACQTAPSPGWLAVLAIAAVGRRRR